MYVVEICFEDMSVEYAWEYSSFEQAAARITYERMRNPQVKLCLSRDVVDQVERIQIF